MREKRLVIYPFEDMQIHDYKAIQEANDHARAEVSGYIPFGRREDYIEAGKKRTWVQVAAVSDDGEMILFYGIIEQLRLEISAGVCTARVNLCSGTRLMDVGEHTRSFQDKTLTYHDLLDVCGNEYTDMKKIMTVAKGEKIDRFIMQYHETDWEFIKRLAAMNHTAVFADCSTGGEKYYFGIPDRKAVKEEMPDEYRMQYDMPAYRNKKDHNKSVCTEDTISYVFESRDIHQIGDRKIIDGKEFFIWRIESCLKGNELYHTCYMMLRSGFQTKSYDNERLSGVSLLGKVVGVKEEKVQIRIDRDENKERSGNKWYSYATNYSSVDGTGWYCMPEKGDAVRLYFPTPREEDAYVASAYHEEGAVLRTHPECKFWRNKEGKEIRLSPGQILLTNNNGTYIELSDEDGIEVVSQGSVTVRTSETLSISSSNASIEMNAPDKIRLRQGDSEMNLGGDLRMQGAKIRL